MKHSHIENIRKKQLKGESCVRKFSIGYRTLKTAIGASLAIAIAQFFNLDFYTSAGILTILCVQPTKKKSLHAVFIRIVAISIALSLSYLFFGILGYNPIVMALMLLIYIPTLVYFKVTEAFVSSAVIIFHIYSVGNFTTDLLWNELCLMTIGFTIGLLVNMYMPDIQSQLKAYQIEIEHLYSKIFEEIAKYLRDGDTLWDGKELVEADKVLNKAKALAFSEVENHLTRKKNGYYLYFDMREKQLEIIERVLPKITTLPVIVQQAEIVAVFMDEISKKVHSGNTASLFREKLEEVKNEFAKMPLPDTHEKFLAMASLYQFIEEMDAYLIIKQNQFEIK